MRCSPNLGAKKSVLLKAILRQLASIRGPLKFPAEPYFVLFKLNSTIKSR